MVYFFIQQKTQQQYQHAFRVLPELNFLSEPTKIVNDFEKAAISIFKPEFSTASIKGCFLHFAQGNWPKIKDRIGV